MRCVCLFLVILVVLGIVIIPSPGRTDMGPLQMSGGGATLKSPDQVHSDGFTRGDDSITKNDLCR